MSRMTTKTAPKTPTTNDINDIKEDSVYPDEVVKRIVMSLDLLDAVLKYDSLPADAYATGEPLDGLILTLLSQNTNDRNRDKAYESLRSACPTWEDVARRTATEIAVLIRSAGLGDTKAARMRDILKVIRKDFGSYSLVAMNAWEPGKVKEYLSNLPGIGPKTVACVMVFDLNMPAFPVDTHVARISRRLGWVPEKWPPEKIQDFLESVVPAERCRGGHLNMIEHGRRVCHARKPECPICVLQGLCDYRRMELETKNDG